MLFIVFIKLKYCIVVLETYMISKLSRGLPWHIEEVQVVMIILSVFYLKFI